MTHPLPSDLRRREVRIDLVGVGGTGSLLLPELARLHTYLRAADHPGLRLCAWDPDRVTAASVGRGVYRPGDVGHRKAAVMVTAVNAAYGTCWYGVPQAYEWPIWNTAWTGEPPDIVITAVDTLRARAELYRAMRTSDQRPPRYWMDLGNDATSGQVILGEVEWDRDPDRFEREKRARLRHVVDLFPQMSAQAETEEPEPESCDLLTAVARQALTINRHMATWGYELLWQLFRYGGLDWHGVFVNARTGQVNPIPVDAPSPEDVQRRIAALLGRRPLAAVEEVEVAA